VGAELVVEVTGPDGAQALVPIAGATLTIGSAPTCALVLNHEGVAHHHAMAEVQRNGVVIMNLSPSNVTCVDGTRVDGARIVPYGREIEIANYRLRFSRRIAHGPIDAYLRDPRITEVLVIDHQSIYCELDGRLIHAPARFSTDDALRSVIERLAARGGRRIDERHPVVTTHLADGTRVKAVLPPLAPRGASVCFRKGVRVPLDPDAMVAKGMLDERMTRFLRRAVAARCNIVVAGGAGAGKTTMLELLTGSLSPKERIVLVEDQEELTPPQPYLVRLTVERFARTMRDLVREALAMRPDRIVVGECGGGEAVELLQAMNSGQAGTVLAINAESPVEALLGLEELMRAGGVDRSSRVIRSHVAAAVNLVVQLARFSDGTRRVTQIAEVAGFEDDGLPRLRPIFELVRDPAETPRFRLTGYVPSFFNEL
jgi:pilus assembly protein CpaF